MPDLLLLQNVPRMPQNAFSLTGNKDIVHSQKMRNRNFDQQAATIFVHLQGRQIRENVYSEIVRVNCYISAIVLK